MTNALSKFGDPDPEQLKKIEELFDNVERGELTTESGLIVSPHLSSTLPQERVDEIIVGVALELNMTPAQVVERFRKTLQEKAKRKLN